jgi:hypothetical protein
MKRRSFVARILAVGCVIVTSVLITKIGIAQSDTMQNVKLAMSALKDKTAKLGAPKREGTERTGDRDWPILYFGTTKLNNSTEVVDEVVKEHGGIATLYVLVDAPPPHKLVRFVSASTTVKKADGARAVGTTLPPESGAILALGRGESVYPDLPREIGGQMYYLGYEPIKDASGKVVGAYSVGAK